MFSPVNDQNSFFSNLNNDLYQAVKEKIFTKDEREGEKTPQATALGWAKG